MNPAAEAVSDDDDDVIRRRQGFIDDSGGNLLTCSVAKVMKIHIKATKTKGTKKK